MIQDTLANLYRPKTFSDVVGQDLAVSTLKKLALADGISARAVLLQGSHGSGKTTLARIAAKAFNCERFKEIGDVCNECDSCKEAESKNSHTCIECDATVVGNVAGIEALKERLSISVVGRRVVVIDEVHACSRQSQTMLLKVLEDGVPNTMFIFCTTDSVLPTIQSRSICIDITTLPESLIADRLKKIAVERSIQITDNHISLICMKSGGHLRDALQILQLYELSGERAIDSSYSLIREFFINSLMGEPKKNPKELLDMILRYPIIDVKMSLGQFIRNIFTANPGTIEEKLLRGGIGKGLFGFFFSPQSQQALRSEVGTEIVFRAYLETRNKN